MEVVVVDADIAADVAVLADLHACSRGDDNGGGAAVVAYLNLAPLPGVEDDWAAHAHTIAAPACEQAHMIANNDTACRTGLDPDRAAAAEVLAQPATLQPATQHRTKRGPSHVDLDAQDIIGGVEFIEEGANRHSAN